MSDERKKVYRAHLTTNPAVGEPCFCWFGYLSDCGEWVEGGDTRWRRTREWCDSEAEAKAVLAPQLASMGSRLIEKAAELLAAGEEARAGVPA